jgi:quercetin dioxygenase-like cupin family protein
MKRPTLKTRLTAVALIVLGASTTLVAQALTEVLAPAQNDSAARVEHRRTDLSGAPGMEVIVSTAEYRPGDHIDVHLHHGVEAVYVVQGATVQAPGKPAMTLQTGAAAMNLREVKHAGFTVVGERPLKLFTVHIVDKGKPLYDYAH